ncbi:hypothetical protein MIB92_00115 [Aestuariirhabdus sp. Z084]|uniref:hypothetical protein n=1 Tax=Aestuariirhabdus haliotis TaxID=2918751 RepID=UPI00201B45BB|nr:hypothetical protein [Aestuariirhabdus haliotis]MCL6414039.1 hypothetical protein [Aestuariirhabdus haliotis]MCL6417972.1 hypothetical protein [Aestuariirhabdus haliotis]
MLPAYLKKIVSQGIVLSILGACPVAAIAADWGGHIKYRYSTEQYSDSSLFRPAFGHNSEDHGADFRLKFHQRQGQWSVDVHYQLQARHGDSLELRNRFPTLSLLPDSAPNDDRRLMRLTRTFHEDDREVRLHRLDRLSVAWHSPQWVARIGRQAISWGNGLFYTPMDIFNPFDPAAIDKEYKNGDDMFYGQWLSATGSDLQLVWVVRRDPLTQQIENEQASQALKYHGFFSDGEGEVDLLLAQHFDDDILGVGLLHNIGEGIWRGDLTLSRSESSTVVSFVNSLSWSWVGWEKNMSAILEYYYNGFGELDSEPSLASIQNNDRLTERLARGELYTLGRHYLATSLTVEVTPLLRVTPNLFAGLQSPSALAQLVVEYDVTQSMRLLSALEIPLGPDGSEFGGIQVPGVGTNASRYLSRDSRLTLQLGWYF